MYMYTQVHVPDFRYSFLVPDILLPLLRGLGGFFLSCTTGRQGVEEGERERGWKGERERGSERVK